MKISARNVLKGKIVDVKKGATTSHVTIDIGGAVGGEDLHDLRALGLFWRRGILQRRRRRRRAAQGDIAGEGSRQHEHTDVGGQLWQRPARLAG